MVHLLLVIIYLAFISLGLPDALLGSAWPIIHQDMHVDLSYAGIISIIISAGTIFSSLQSDRLTRRFGAGRVTAFSVLMTAIALFGFSMSNQFWMLCLWAIPYGLGAGSVDASLNNYVALHYKSHHMNWLHCMWGIGAATGPSILSAALLSGTGWIKHPLYFLNSFQINGWQGGYYNIAIIQIILTMFLFFSLPLWDNHSQSSEHSRSEAPALSLLEIFKFPGAKEVMISFFCYCGLEQSAGLWASSFFVMRQVEPEIAASYAGYFFIGITVGRVLSGFLTFKFSDEQLIRIGSIILLLGVGVMALPNLPVSVALTGLVLIGLGCAPIYPSIIHMSPRYFGKDKSQAIIGVQMASAYIGSLAMPPLFGIIAKSFGLFWLPYFIGILTLIMFYTAEKFTQTKTVDGTVV